jgi:signal transduction histidine kinase
MRTIDWARTPVGPVESWPQSLLTALDILLQSPFPMFLWWGPELVQFYNDGFRPSLGTTKHPGAMGQRGRACWADIWPTIGPMVDAVMQRGEPVWFEDQLIPIDRNGFWEEVFWTFSYSPVRAEDGSVGGTLVVVHETTLRVQAQRRLRTLHELAATTVDNRSAQEVCRMAADVLSRNPSDVPFALLYLVDPKAEMASLAATTGMEPGTAASPLSIPLTEPTGRGVWPLAESVHSRRLLAIHADDLSGPLPGGVWQEPTTSIRVVPVGAARSDELPAAVLVAGCSPRIPESAAYDEFMSLIASQISSAITHARAYEQERRRAELLAELDRAKTIFFTNVSHEFRTPLTLLLGPTEDALEDTVAPLARHQRERLELVRRNAYRLEKLVNTLLEFSRIEAGRAGAAFRKTDVAGFTRDLAGTFRSAIEHAGLRLEVDCPQLPGDIEIYVDPQMWERIVLNLLSNALKFTFEGSICVLVRVVGTEMHLTVSDTGVGISKDQLPHLFERFRRIEGARARTHEGSGIGLAMVHELVRLHGGRVTVSSSAAGSTFTVALPLGAAHLPADQVATTAVVASTAGAAPFVEEALRWLPEAEPPQAEVSASIRPRILWIDDNADLRAYVSRLLGADYAVDAVATAQAGIEAALAHPPDLVLTDIMLPGADGFALVHELRARPETAHIPVIMLSARAGEEARIEGLESGADDYLVKPFTARELRARIAAHLALQRQRRQELAVERNARSGAELARKIAERASTRALAVQAVTAGLANTVTVTQISDVIMEHVVPVLGAAAAMLVLRTENPEILSTVAPACEAGSVEDLYLQIPIGADLPAAEVVRTGQALWIESAESVAGRFPDWTVRTTHQAMAVLPLVVDDQCSGALQVGFTNERPFGGQDRAFLGIIAGQCAAAVHRVDLHAAAELARHQAEAALLARDEFLRTLAHDLKTPVVSLLWHVQLLARQLFSEGGTESEVGDLLAIVEACANEVVANIDELRDLVQQQEGSTLDLEAGQFDVQSLLTEAVAITSDGGEHTVRIVSEARAVLVTGDRARLSRALGNLLDNAFKYSPPGSEVVLRVARVHHDRRWWALIHVEDHGLGIPPAETESVFERYARGTNVAHAVRGEGIGLASARQLVESHGGRLTVRSTECIGSVFTMWLPCSVV